MRVLNHDLIIFGAGLAGLRAALEAMRISQGKLNIALVSKVQLMRAHSVGAEGGTAAVLRPEDGDSIELHAWDTVKGSDFLADQDVIVRFVETMPEEILQLDRWGLPWSRRPDGKIDQRPFGGHSFPRATFAADKTGFFEMQTLYDALQKYGTLTRYDEWFVTSILAQDGLFQGLTAIDMKTGEFCLLSGKSLIIATGGAGRLFGFTTYALTVTGDGMAIAYRAGIPLKDMEFFQFHPTGLVPSGILISEAARGEGGYLVNANGDRFMQNYASEKMELAPRDIISRSMITEIENGRGYKGPRGLDYLLLDLRHLGASIIEERLPFIRELAIKFAGLDPIHEPIPVRPVAHYSMGGIDVDIDGASCIKGVWAAGETACVSVHGANRLGTNSTAECLAYGKITGGKASEYAMSQEATPKPDKDVAEGEEKRIFEDFLSKDGPESVYQLRRELQEVLDTDFYVFRTQEQLSKALEKVHELKDRFKRIRLEDKRKVYNTDLLTALETENLLDLSEVAVSGALARTESRGAHARRDYPKRDDVNWLKHTLAYYTPDGPRLDEKPVIITKWQPVERKY